jgi:hypothetical protein
MHNCANDGRPVLQGKPGYLRSPARIYGVYFIFIFILSSFLVCFLLFFFIGFYVTPTQYRLYGDVPALLVEEDLSCLSVHYFRHKRAPE